MRASSRPSAETGYPAYTPGRSECFPNSAASPNGDRGIRGDLRRCAGSLNRQSTVQAGGRLPQFTKPALIAWSADDEFFPLEDTNRVAAALPNSPVEMIPQAKTFSMVDQSDILAHLITDFAGAGPDSRGAF
jgi:pimeloyl-ACP methyl ester carboxylesterase